MSLVEKKIKQVVKEMGIPCEFSEHEPVHTSEDAARVRGEPLNTGVKSLLLKTSEGKFILALVRGDRRADMKALARLEGVRRLQLANPAEVMKLTGTEPGGVSPFGHRKKLKTYMDKSILESPEVNFNTGDPCKTAKMSSSDLRKIVNPIMF